jgi:hypothetical protein
MSALFSVPQSSDNDVDRQREERLVQWQLELFTRLLKRIVAARIEKNKSLGNVDLTGCRETLDDDEVSFEGLNDSHTRDFPRINEDANTGSASLENLKRASIMKPNEESAFKMPRRRSSLRGFSSHSVSTLFSVDSLPVSILGSSVGDLSFAESEHSQPKSNLTLGDFEEGDKEDVGKIVVDEVAEIIALPQFSVGAINAFAHADKIQLSEEIVSQLRDYISTIAHMYRKNPFHNFEVSSLSSVCGKLACKTGN